MTEARQDHSDRLGRPVRRAKKVHQEIWAVRVRTAQKEKQVQKAQQVQKGDREKRGQLGRLAKKDTLEN